MNIIRYQPNSFVHEFQKELNRFFDTNYSRGDNSNVETSEWLPAVDIKEEPTRFVILADVPGVDPKNIEIQMDQGLLTIKGERKSEVKDEREGYKRIERSSGIFYRRFSLPETADAKNITATSKHGVLELTIPKIEKAKPQTIQVKVEEAK